MDKYTKAVLTVVAISLVVIALKLGQPKDARAGVPSSPPTYGEFLALRDIKDEALRKDAYMKLMRSIPVVRVQGGQIDANVSGSVEIDH